LSYYFVKWGFKKESQLVLNTAPDSIIFNLAIRNIKHDKGLLKAVFRLVRERNIKYYKDRDKMVVYSKNKQYSIELDLNIEALQTIEEVLLLTKNFKDYDNNLFIVNLNDVKFLIQKKSVSNIGTLKETVIAGEYSFLYPYVKGKIVLDIGSNIGDSPVVFCMNGAKKVFAYEPHPFLYNLSLKNIKLNKLEGRVKVKNYGVGDKEYVVSMKEDSPEKFKPIFGKKENSTNRDIQMKIIPFLKIIENMSVIDVLKMDCEGAEFPAILSVPVSILKKIKVIGMEYHADPKSLVIHLEKAGFRVDIREDAKTDKHLGLLFAVQKNQM